MALKGQRKGGSSFERTIFPEGTYDMQLRGATVYLGKPNKNHPGGQIKVIFTWVWTDEDGTEIELPNFVGFPKNVKWNEKSAFWKHVSEIAGVPNTEDMADATDMDFQEMIESYEELVELVTNEKDDRGNTCKAHFTTLTVNGKELFGKVCRLVVGVWTGEDGNQGNEIPKVMQIGAAQRPVKPQRAAAPAAQAAARPAARPAAPAQQAAPGVSADELPY